jgi:pyruvate dehydrogenase E2 component (dihydrolipoamide acetyltransferase)
MAEFILPNLGDGVDSGDVLAIMVKAGDTIKVDQAILELETDKATLEVPSDVAGTIKEVRVKVGDKVKPGQAVLVVDDAAGEGAADSSKPEPEKAEPEKADAKKGRPAEPEKTEPEKAEPEKAEPEKTETQEAKAAGTAPEAPAKRSSVVEFQARPAAAPATGPAAPASPSVRRLAREIGVDVQQVPGSGPGGRISQDDVKEFSRKVLSSMGSGAQAAAAARPAGGGVALPDFSKWGDVERRPMTGIRRKTSEHLSHAWTTIPHVTQFDKADITALEQLRKRHGAEVEKAGGKLTVTSIVAHVLAHALHRFPQFNASVDAAAESIVYKKYVNVGIAVDTEHGLLVPVIRDADRKNIVDLSVEIQQLADKAKARKLSLDEMSGGSMSITNLGGIGGTAFAPIVNWPEVAILGLSRGATEPVWANGQFEPRLMLPLSLSYDHRLIDGADAIRFLRWVVEALEQPFTLALRG